MFDLDVVNAFSKSAVSLLRNSCSIEIHSGNISIHQSLNHIRGIIAFVGIIGDFEGRILINMEKKASFSISSALNNEEINSIDEIHISSMKELANMIAAGAINELALLHISLDITPPAILISENLFIFESQSEEILTICYNTNIGNIYINIIIFDKK